LQGSESTTAAFLDEGEKTLGVWLPLALADITALLIGLTRAWSATPEEIKVPQRSETLAGWCLPMLSKSLAAAEEEHKALQLLRSVQMLKARQEARRKAKKENDGAQTNT
jgi:hypothetical protein